VPECIVRERVIGALEGALHRAKQRGLLKSASIPAVTLDLPKRPEWGDLASTVALALAPTEQRPPQEVAQIIAENLSRPDTLFDRVEIARPGFLNLTVKRELWLEVLLEIERLGAGYGRSEVYKGRRVLVEYVSANPTGPLHVGHGRNAAVGQALANLLTAAGGEVVREYYVNDAGRQMQLLGASVYARYRQLHGQDTPFPEDGYRGAYIEALAARLKDQVGADLLEAPREEAEERCRAFAYRELLDAIRLDLRAFGIDLDNWFSEAALLASGAVEKTLSDLRAHDLLFEQDGALWFRSSAFGDEKDRVVKKQEGDYTYLAPDVAYHRDKLQRGFDLLIDVWGADHHGYIPRMQAAVQAFGHPKDRLRVVLIQMVNLTRGGKKVEMSKRAGEFVTLREVMDEVGADAAKFFFLMRRSDTHLDFDLELAKRQSAENPVYYVQYAHARIASLFRVAGERCIAVPKPSQADLRWLRHPDEYALIRHLCLYPSLLQGSAMALEPHRLTFYLQELAMLLHTFYFKHRILPLAGEPEATEADQFAQQDGAPLVREREELTPGLTGARLALMYGVQLVIRNALGILGVSAPERM